MHAPHTCTQQNTHTTPHTHTHTKCIHTHTKCIHTHTFTHTHTHIHTHTHTHTHTCTHPHKGGSLPYTVSHDLGRGQMKSRVKRSLRLRSTGQEVFSDG